MVPQPNTTILPLVEAYLSLIIGINWVKSTEKVISCIQTVLASLKHILTMLTNLDTPLALTKQLIVVTELGFMRNTGMISRQVH